MDQMSRLLRIGIFYDGNYFYHVSNYYCYVHNRRARLSIPGLHDLIKSLVSCKEAVPEKLCQIVDCHYFRGRLSAMEAKARQILLNERIFDDILMREGVVTHYLPVTRGGEKGVDVSLALEALELTIFKKFNVVILIASDGDYVPLVRKLNALGTRVMVLGWNFTYMDDNGNEKYTSTSAKLLNESSYPVLMHDFIEGISKPDPDFDFNIDKLFVYNPGQQQEQFPTDEGPTEPIDSPENDIGNDMEQRLTGKIVQLKSGYGFIALASSGKNIFFFWQDLVDSDFNALQTGDTVEFSIGRNDRGECAKNITVLR